jgi:hypothetical protein
MAGEESGNRKPVNWTKPDNLHVTLAFLGERKDPESVIRALRSVSFEPFRIECGPFRKFGDALTVGIRDGGESVRLAKASAPLWTEPESLTMGSLPFPTRPLPGISAFPCRTGSPSRRRKGRKPCPPSPS